MSAPTPSSRGGLMAVAPAQVLPTSQLLAARQQTWEGLHVGYAHFPPGDFLLPPITGHLLTLHLGPPVSAVRQRAGYTQQGVKVYGDLELVPAGSPSFWAYDQPHESFGLILEAAFVQQVARQVALRAPAGVELRHQFGVRDPLVTRLGLALYAEVMSPGPGGRLLAESVAQLLAVHLLRTYAATPPLVRASPRGLPPATLRRALEYLQAHLTTEVSLTALAATVRMSPYHFARLFKQSTGQSPHQYVLARRIAQAQHLLATTSLPIATIAYQVGFTSQSHLARHFRRRTGVTPKAYRDAC